MATNTDVMINVEADISKLIQDLQNAEKALKQTQTTINNQLNPSTQTFSNKLSSVGNRVTQLGNTIKQKIGTEAALAFGVLGAAATSFAKQCVESAVSAESAWTQMNALLSDSNSGVGMSIGKAKTEIKKYANEWGYTVADVRAAGNALLLTGLDNDKLMLGLEATAGVAARTGKNMQDSSTLVSRALAGNGRDFERLTGLRLKDYEMSNGQIDKERLLTDLYTKNSDAINKHADTTEAALNRMGTAWGTIKTEIGEALLPVVKMVADAAQGIALWFRDLPDPVKQFIATILLIVGAVGTVLGVLGFLAPVFTAIGGAISFVAGIIGPVISTISFLVTLFGSLGVAGSVTFIFELLAAAAGALLTAIAPLILPIIAVVGAFTLLYLTGQQLGWWNDITGMIMKFGEAIMWVAGQIGAFLGWIGRLFTDFPGAMQQAGETLGGFKDIILNALGGLYDIGVNTAMELWNGFMDRINDFTSHVSETLAGIDWGALSQSVLTELGNIAQAFLMTSPILGALTALVTSIVNWFLDLLGIHSPGFMAQAIQEEMGHIAEFISGAVGAIVGAIVSLASGIWNGFVGAIVGLATMIGQAFMLAVQTIQTRLNQARAIAGMLVSMLVQAVVTRFNLLVARVRMVFMMVVNAIVMRLRKAWAMASQLAGMIRQVIVTRFNLIVGRAKQIFQNIVNTIRQKLRNAVNTAKDKAKEIYDGIKQKITEIPQAVADEFGKIPDKIRSALDNAKNIAVTKISELVSAVKSALGIASPGFIQRMMAFEFNSIPGIISDSSVLAIREAGKMATGIVDTWQDNMTSLGMPGLSMSGADYSNLVRGQSVDLFGQQPMAHLDTALLTSSMNVPRQPMGSGQGMIQNTTNNSDDHTTHIHVENISLDCNHLTKQESRRILYDALDGLYTGGI